MPANSPYTLQQFGFWGLPAVSMTRMSLTIVGAYPPGGNAEMYSGQLSVPIFGPSVPFTDLGPHSPSLLYGTVTRMQDGEVFVAGGLSGNAAAETWVTSASGFVHSMPMAEPRYGHAATLLNNGTILVCGGFTWRWGRQPRGPQTIELGVSSRAEIYDPRAGSFGHSIPMSSERANHTATTLPDGKVVIVGGVNSAFNLVPTIEVFDPTTSRFEAIPGEVRTELHTASLIGNSVIVIGGYGANGVATQNGFDIDVQRQGDFCHNLPKFLQHARGEHTATTIGQRGDQQILVLGGASDSRGTQLVLEGELVSVLGHIPSGGQNIRHGRFGHAASLSPGGILLVVGGADTNRNPVMIAEGWRPAHAVPGQLHLADFASFDIGSTNFPHGAGVRIA